MACAASPARLTRSTPRRTQRSRVRAPPQVVQTPDPAGAVVFAALVVRTVLLYAAIGTSVASARHAAVRK